MTQPVIKPRLLTVKGAAEYLGKTPDAIRGMRKRGTLKCVKLDGSVRFDIQYLDRLIDAAKEAGDDIR